MNRPLIVDDIVSALTMGMSVAATGPGDIGVVLDAVATTLTGSGMRVLQFRPPLDAASFVRQFAGEWQITGKGSQAKGIPAPGLPEAAGERVVLLIQDAQRLPHETFRHLEQFAQAWPWMQMAFAGRPGVIEALMSGDFPTLKRRVSVFVDVPDTTDRRLHQGGNDVSLPTGPAGSVLNPLVLNDLFPMPEAPPVPGRRIGVVAGIWVFAIAAILMATTPMVPDVHAPVMSPAAVQADPREDTAATPIDQGPLPSLDPAVVEPLPDQAGPALGAIGATTSPPASMPEPEPAVAEAVPETRYPPQSNAGLPLAMADAMVRRGQAMLVQGDVSAARLLFERAANSGSAGAARAMGMTFDAAYLGQIGAVGIRPDPAQAAQWYRQALSLGDGEADTLLDALQPNGGASAVQRKTNP